MSFSLVIGSMIVCLLASLTVYLRGGSPIYLKIFPFFILITIVEEEFAVNMTTHGKSNIVVYNFFSVFAFCFYFYVFYNLFNRPLVKKLLIAFLIAYPLISIWNIVQIQGINNFNTMSFSLGSLLIVGLSIYYFIEMFQMTKAVNPLRDSGFWICTGLMFFFTCLFPYFGFVNFMIHLPKVFVVYFDAIVTIANLFMYSLFSIAFLCRIPIRSFM